MQSFQTQQTKFWHFAQQQIGQRNCFLYSQDRTHESGGNHKGGSPEPPAYMRLIGVRGALPLIARRICRTCVRCKIFCAIFTKMMFKFRRIAQKFFSEHVFAIRGRVHPNFVKLPHSIITDLKVFVNPFLKNSQKKIIVFFQIQN